LIILETVTPAYRLGSLAAYSGLLNAASRTTASHSVDSRFTKSDWRSVAAHGCRTDGPHNRGSFAARSRRTIRARSLCQARPAHLATGAARLEQISEDNGVVLVVARVGVERASAGDQA